MRIGKVRSTSPKSAAYRKGEKNGEQMKLKENNKVARVQRAISEKMKQEVREKEKRQGASKKEVERQEASEKEMKWQEEIEKEMKRQENNEKEMKRQEESEN